jgi:competence protein ComEA
MHLATRVARAFLPAWLLALGLALAAGAEDGHRLQGVVNVNTASVQELQLLPGVGEARARAIVDLRKQRGGLKSLDELRDVKGIGDASLEKLRPHVTFDGKTTARLE